MSGINEQIDIGGNSRQSKLAARSCQVIPGGVNSGQRQVAGIDDLVIVRTAGPTFTTADGDTFTDYHAAFGPPLLGHNDPDVDEAAAATARRLDLMGVGVTDVEIELAEKLVGLFPSFDRVLLTATGSEATFHAVRVARAATGRKGLMKFQGCYHGWHDSVAMNVISPREKVGTKDVLSEGILDEVVDATVVARFNDLDDVRRLVGAQPDGIAAMILEPIPHNIGAVLPEEGFLSGLRSICDEHGIVLIFDEVITGIRHGLGGFQKIAGVKPDLTTLGKALGNGYPIGALGGRAELMEMFSTTPGRPAFFAGTYNGHPMTTAAALATIAKIEAEPVHEHIYRLGALAREALKELYNELGVPTVVTGYGSVFVTYFLEGPVRSYDDLLDNDVELFVGYRRKLMEDRVFELPLNLKRSHFSFAHEERHVDELLEATRRAVRAVLDERVVLAR
jgi:glutamate-1-semialdehyde 2,1-aminomutase